MARVEMMRHYGIVYKEMEDNHVMLPVLEMKLKYIRPAYYDDVVTIHTVVSERPGTRLFFTYKWYNPGGKLMTEAETLLCFVNMKTGKPCLPPDYIGVILDAHFKP
jgi:acyl-CoA thioester hydrolase